MKLFSKELCIVALFLELALFAPLAGMGCRCANPPTPKAYKDADAVVMATALTVVERPDTTQTATLEISRAWKKNVDEEITVLAGGEECGHFFVEGQKYIIYLYLDDEGRFTTRNCVGNKFFNNPDLPARFAALAKKDLKWLKRHGTSAAISPKAKMPDVL